MGPVLSEPITEKTSVCERDNFMCVGSSCMQGWRSTMEDAHIHLLKIDEQPGCRFFAVYDGHGSKAVAQNAKELLHGRIFSRQQFREGKIAEAMKEGFLSLDDEMMKDEKFKFNPAGSTAVVVLMKNDTIYCANAGDSRGLVSVRGGQKHLSHDHKPQNEEELRRIEEAGGFVNFNRVNGSIALSRALGDFDYKRNQNLPPEKQIITAFPDVIEMKITPDHEFFVIACDGIWDCMDNQEVVDFVRTRLAENKEPHQICEEIMMNCLSSKCRVDGRGCDNMTIVIGVFLHDGTYEEAAERCRRPCTPSAVRRPVSSDLDEEGTTSAESGASAASTGSDESASAETVTTDVSAVEDSSEGGSTPTEARSAEPPKEEAV